MAHDRRERWAGLAFVLAATLAWSSSAVYTRLLETDVWTTIACRSLFGSIFLLGAGVFLPGSFSARAFRATLRPAAVTMILCQVYSQAAFIGALHLSSVANVYLIGATGPIMAALMSRLVLGEKITRRTGLAAAACIVGVGITIGPSFHSGAFAGDLLALSLNAVCSIVIVLPRLDKKLPVLQPTIVSGFITFTVFWPFAAFAVVKPVDFAILAVFGATHFCFSLIFYIEGARRLRPAETALIGTTEVIWAPLTVWLLFSEQPSLAALLGGAVIVLTVLIYTISSFRDTASDEPYPKASRARSLDDNDRRSGA